MFTTHHPTPTLPEQCLIALWLTLLHWLSLHCLLYFFACYDKHNNGNIPETTLQLKQPVGISCNKRSYQTLVAQGPNIAQLPDSPPR